MRTLAVAESARLALQELPDGPEHAALAGAIALIARRFGPRSCRSIQSGEIGAWLLRWRRLDRGRYELLRLAWIRTLAPAGVAAPVPTFDELAPEPQALPLEPLWRGQG